MMNDACGDLLTKTHVIYNLTCFQLDCIMQTKKIICMSRLLSKNFSSFPDSAAKVRLGFR